MSNPAFDQAVVDVARTEEAFDIFGDQAWRFSNAVTSGSFGDQPFAPILPDSVGETSATAGTFAVGTRYNRFEASFDFGTTQLAQQPGLVMNISPDRGDGSRMSFLRLRDLSNGIAVDFFDVSGTTSPVSFVESPIAVGLSRAVPHNIRMVFTAVEGPSNDIVQVFVDGSLVHTGTSWENYYRFDNEASAEQTPRLVKTLLFRSSGTAAPANLGNGYLFDNVRFSATNAAE